MQIKLFTIPANDTGEYTDEMNRFLRANKILLVDSNFVGHENNAVWYFCVKYISLVLKNKEIERKIDYREVLDEATFNIFSKLRECRKQIAGEDAIPAYAVFTDAELVSIAKLQNINEKNIITINGIGDKKIERYGKRFVELYLQKTDETSRLPN